MAALPSSAVTKRVAFAEPLVIGRMPLPLRSHMMRAVTRYVPTLVLTQCSCTRMSRQANAC